jgi:uncharacterized FlaG/YvyC family protein
MNNDQYEVITQIDEETGDILLPIPPELLHHLGWNFNTQIEFSIDQSGDLILSKVNK